MLALVPSGAFAHAVYTDVVGLALGAGLVALELWRRIPVTQGVSSVRG